MSEEREERRGYRSTPPPSPWQRERDAYVNASERVNRLHNRGASAEQITRAEAARDASGAAWEAAAAREAHLARNNGPSRLENGQNGSLDLSQTEIV